MIGGADNVGMTDDDGQVLLSGFGAVVCDLDGVVYRGGEAISGAVEALNDVRRSGVRIAFATNNASRPPGVVVDQLRSLGVDLDDRDVVTSAQAGARAMLCRTGPGASILAIGGPGVQAALTEVGLVGVSAAEARAGAGVSGVLQGFGTAVVWTDLAEASYAIQGGAVWVATNSDTTLPTERGTAPGNGTLIGAVRQTVDVDPVVVGKPESPLYQLAADLLRCDLNQTLAVGDRLTTDIAGAHAAGMPSLLVLTGVHGPSDAAAAPPAMRPDFVASTLAALCLPYAAPTYTRPGTWTCGKAVVQLVEGASSPGGGAPAAAPAGGSSVARALPSLVLNQPGSEDEQLRAALALLWRAVDDGSVSPAESRRVMSAFATQC